MTCGLYHRIVVELQPPVAVEIPVLALQLHRMLGTIGSVATTEILDGAILVATPANAFGVLGVTGKLLGHGESAATLLALSIPIFRIRGVTKESFVTGPTLPKVLWINSRKHIGHNCSDEQL
jgi:hypothetical protein